MNRVKELALKYNKKIYPTVLDSEIGSRLPEAYKKFYREWLLEPSEPVHYLPLTGNIWIREETTGEVKRQEAVPIPLLFPKEIHNVFTGGELPIQGFLKKKKYVHRIPKFWMPVAYKSVVYSEILDKYLSVLMTKRVVQLIHKHHGLDQYLLKTKACDLKTLVAIRLKKKLLLALSNKDLPYDEVKNNEIYKKYEQYLIPAEEIEWYGLNFTEACNKLKEIEEAHEEASKIPLKHVYRINLIKQLQEVNLAAKTVEESLDKSSILGKIPGLGRIISKTSN